MSDFFDFITENPVAAIFIFWFLYRMFFGGNDKTKKAVQQQRAQMRENPARAGESEKKSFQERLEEALRNAEAGAQPARERVVEEPARSTPPQMNAVLDGPTLLDAPTLLEQHRTPSQGGAMSADPYAFQSLMQPGVGDEGVEYELNSDSFSYHAPLNEPDDVAYHTSGFSGFHEAHGLSHDRGKQPSVVEEETEESHQPVLPVLMNNGDLRRAILLNEILGRPRSLRGIRS